jgi:hypothetical protein
MKINLEREKDADGNVINSPSLIARIHDINFSATLFRFVREKGEIERQVQMDKLEKTLETLNQESEAPVILK